MYIENGDQKSKRQEEKLRKFWNSHNADKNPPEPEEEPDGHITKHVHHEILYHWQGPEFEEVERDRKWYLVVTTLLILIIAWAIYSDSLIMAITFILIGMVGYIYIHHEPRTLDFAITYDGMVAGNELYHFDNLESFWIFYEPPHTKILSLKSRGILLPYVHVPLHDEDPVKIREILMDFIPEAKQEDGVVQIMERLIRL